MEKNPKRFAMVLVGVIAVLAVLGAVRLQFFAGTDAPLSAAPAKADKGLAPGKVTMIDLGATECIPCKMMAPIIEELKKEYADGKEVHRNTGFMDKKRIVAVLTRLGLS